MAETGAQGQDSASAARQRRIAARNRLTLFLKILFGLILFLMVTGIGVAIGFVTANINAKPDISKDILPPASSQIYDSAGNEIANIHAVENRMPVKIEQVPADLQHAFIAVEDNRFYEHKGVDPKGLARAFYANLRDQEIAEGGSTITQQLAKNAYLTQERTFKRKIQEIFLALQIEKQYTKQEILEMYMNQIYFGQGAYGVQAAAKIYFDKNVEDLNLSECALLAGIPKSPNYYSPFNNMQAALQRRNTVLDQMVKYHYISPSEAREAKNTEIAFAQPNRPEEQKDAMYFINYVTNLMVEKYGADALYKEGLKIYTTIDLDIQRMAEQALLTYLPEYYTDANGVVQPQGAIVAIDPKTGYVKAMVGGRGTDQFNRASMAERQPGSAFKPFVFVTALENNFTPDTIIEDSPITIDGWSPQNDSGRFSGSVTMRMVATYSMNVPTVKLAMAFGMYQAINYAHEMGISTFVLEGDVNDNNYSTALGGLTRGVTPLELTNAYCTFANGGAFIPHIVITKVLDRNGNILEEAIPEPKQVISPLSASNLTSMLEDVIRRGTGRSANIGRPAAGKTGTTSDYHDAWFVGYTPDLVAGVWVGNDDNSPTDGIMGGGIPAMIWSHFMQNALLNTPVHDFDEIVIEQRGAPISSGGGGGGGGTGSQRDEGYYSRQNEPYDDGNNSNYTYDPKPQERNDTYVEPPPETRPTEHHDDNGYNSNYPDTPTPPHDEPIVYEPPSEPIYEPAPSNVDVPSPTDSDDKGRN
ncbi:MAG: penicillin-binding protein 1A [Selenomonadaceae bacterium]|nr:penicillin-binding protein 1A [Selenomonadaceae bacterium]